MFSAGFDGKLVIVILIRCALLVHTSSGLVGSLFVEIFEKVL